MGNVKMFVIMNHALTKDQIEDAKKSLGVTEFCQLPDVCKSIWANLDPERETTQLYRDLQATVGQWLHNECRAWDYVLLDGDAWACHQVIDMTTKDRIEVQDPTFVKATSIRESVETVKEDGTVVKTNVFKHVKFRAYNF